MDTAWIGFINRFTVIALTVAGIVIINYPPTKLAVNITHKKSLSIIGVAWIIYQFLVALNINGTKYVDMTIVIGFARILELCIYIAIGIWGIVSIKEKITLT